MAATKQSQSAQRPIGKNKNNKGAVINVFDSYIKKQLSKDNNLPQIKSITKSSDVLGAIRQSKKISKDKDTVSNLKAVLSIRQQLSSYKPGSVVNGRQLRNPAPLKSKDSVTGSANGGDTIEDFAENSILAKSQFSNPQMYKS